MRLVRYLAGGEVRYGIVEGDRVRELLEPYYVGLIPMQTTRPLAEVDLLAPSRPSKMVCVGLNYRAHAREVKMAIPEEPVIFLKPTGALLGPGRPIIVPSGVGRVDYEAELAIVLGREARGVREDEADSYILGYTCFNDVTARDLQAKDGQWTRSKSFDTFGVLGPWIETDVGDPHDLAVTCRLNGQVRQQSRTSDLAFGCRRLVSWVSRVMTLQAGDVIATGTPAGIGPMQPGDTVEVEVERIGVLGNPVAAEPPGGPAPGRVV